MEAGDRWHRYEPRGVSQSLDDKIVQACMQRIDRSDRRTLWTSESAGLGAPQESAVEVGREGGIGDTAEVVVGLDILLEGLATVAEA